jgi:adenine-specific DNA-methyltransferase
MGTPRTPIRLHWEGRRDPSAIPPTPTFKFTPDPTAVSTSLLFHCDNLDAIGWAYHAQERSDLPKANLIYIDPPYAMEAKQRIDVRDERGQRSEVAYSDYWGDPAKYLQFMWDRLVPMRELLAEDGVLCVHCDWRANAWLRLLLDEVYGRDCFRNEITWRRAPNLGHQATARQLGRTTDTILVYTRTPGCAFRGQLPIRSTPVELTRTGRPRGSKWDADRKSWFTTAQRGDYTDASIESLRAQGRVHDTPSGKQYIKYFLREGDDKRWYKDQPVDTLWADETVRPLRHCTKEELEIGYPTQKPEALLRRIIEWTTREGDMVMDFFCGSGTTLAAAAKLNRRWLGCDSGEHAIRIASARLNTTASAIPLPRSSSHPAGSPAPACSTA